MNLHGNGAIEISTLEWMMYLYYILFYRYY